MNRVIYNKNTIKEYAILSLIMPLLLVNGLFANTVFANTSQIIDSPNNVDNQYEYASETQNNSGTQLIVPDDITWTQRFILSEIKELRTELERTRRELNIELNNRELETVDRALSYSGNMVNFLWLIMTMAVTGFWLVGWRTMKDVRDNLKENFQKEVQKSVSIQQKNMEEFMSTFKDEQLLQSTQLLKNQEKIKKKQEASYLWSQYNREEDMVTRLEILESIDALSLEENNLFIFVERANVYVIIALWDKALENAEYWLELSSENTSLLLSKAQALIMLEETEEALKVMNNIIVIKPSLKEELLENELFDNFHDQINEMYEDQINS